MSLKTLTNLRYLVISGYELSDFSFVNNMKKLQSLSMNDCSLPSFPELQTNVAITQITTLKLLQFYRCKMKGKNFEVIKRTPRLEELYIVEEKWKANSEDNIEFFNTFSVPQTLQRYAIVLGYNDFYYNYNYLHPPSRTLLLNHFDISNEVIKGLAKKATDLVVANIQGGAKNIIPDIFQIEGGGLDELNKFEIQDSEEIECLIETSNHLSEVVTFFSKLHTLRMNNMKSLRALWHCFQPANGPFENLEELYLSDCPRLTSLFTYVVARCLVQLKILKISECDGLKHILADDEKREKNQCEFTIGHPVQIFQNLQEVEVNRCRELKDIFSTSVLKGLAQLKVLNIQECNMLDQIFGDIDPLTYQDKKEELAEIVEEGKHPHLYSTSTPSTTILNHSPGTLSSLASLTIIDCPKLGSIFTASIAKTLTFLEVLIIKRCNSLKHIVTHERVNQQKENIVQDDHDFQSDISIFQSLKTLNISECDLLQYSSKARQEDYIAIKISNSDSIFPVESVQYISKPPHGLTLIIMHNIREINMNGFDKVKYIFKLSIASLLMLEILRIEQCHGLEHIIDTEDEYGKENLNAIFPNLRDLSVRDCGQLTYMFGQYFAANKDCEEMHIHFSALEILSLDNLPNFVSICATNNLTVTWPSLKEFTCYKCAYPFYNSINCLTAPADSREPINASKKISKGLDFGYGR
ncbi:hypothetical protein PHAVU_003G002926 [Phaseolus vulgaris]